ncbi:MAG: aldehyde dehydrogenase family protein [Candidatus Cyclonatronum sp.]|uniref:aldehyde dehydrogenase family protein n=1 Tax=Cyclonatronum sp. TaxID=3024185 RepID=UPI0025BAB607|nr:aldehyde dehydrogenase family protein [Cyclonatronum sp.]MCC5933271.1 aldehyde dehydrogenase family protein [Balneolales bacterium]MCH8485408.1 aldehyde dehydrogenase family protein [Cyclonatronum sp.]
MKIQTLAPPLIVPKRLTVLKALQSAVINAKTAICEGLYQDLGKPPEEAEVTEIIPVISELRHIRKHLKEWSSPKPVNRTLLHFTAKAYVHYQPKGRVLILSPWNYPFNLVMSPLASAIGAGNQVVIKPSEFTPNTNKVIRHILEECLPEGLCTLKEGDARFAAGLTSEPWDHIFFTGSPAIGKKVMKAAAENLVPVTLELGGKSPCIVTRHADVEKAARRIAWGKYINCGQTCIAPDYVMVHENIRVRFHELLEQEIKKRFPLACEGKPTDTGYGKLIHRHHFNRLQALLQDALSQNGKLLFPQYSDENELFFGPAVLEMNKEANQALVMQDEIFGPVLPVLSYSDDDEIFDQLSRNPKPLAAYIFSANNKEIRFWRDRIRTGGFVANDILSHFAHNNLPFGGNGSSGHGRSHGFFGFREFSNEMAVMESGPGPSGAELVGAPYTDLKRKIIDAALKLV